MQDQLPFQARWTVRVLKWLLSREVSLEEMLQDEDVLAGIVTYFTKKVAVEKEIPGQKEQVEKISVLEKELDFVRCRLQGADQQRKNEVQELEQRNAELREEVVKLTHKLKASEKEVFEARFASGNVKAAMKKLEEELRDMRKKVEAQEQEVSRRDAEIAQLAQRRKEMEEELERLRARLEETSREEREKLSSAWEDERKRLLFMLEERENALSEAREGQAAATREIENLSSQLETLNARLALLEAEAVQKGVPVIKVGIEPVVGEKAAKLVAEKKTKPSEDTPVPRPARRRVAANDEPISAAVGFSHKNMLELADDARYVEKVDLDVESIPEPPMPAGGREKPSRKADKAKASGKENTPKAPKTKPADTAEPATETAGAKTERPQAKPADAPASPAQPASAKADTQEPKPRTDKKRRHPARQNPQESQKQPARLPRPPRKPGA